MKKFISITILFGGFLLLVVPRYILPVCEYEGFSRMHCSDTAAAEFIIGALMLVTGGIALAVKKPWLVVISAAVACVLLVLAFFMPEVYGYCANRKMPCHYGMVPGIRFIAVLLSLILITGIALLARDILRRKAP